MARGRSRYNTRAGSKRKATDSMHASMPAPKRHQRSSIYEIFPYEQEDQAEAGASRTRIVESPSPMERSSPDFTRLSGVARGYGRNVWPRTGIPYQTPSSTGRGQSLSQYAASTKRPTRTFSNGRLKAKFEDVVRSVLRVPSLPRHLPRLLPVRTKWVIC